MTSSPDQLWRLSPFYRDLTVEGYRLVSFDVFDTLLHRAVRRPVDVFLHVARRAHRCGLMDEGLDPHDFAALRVRMEVDARRAKVAAGHCDEVTLAEIWQMAPPFLGQPQALMDLELATEYELSFGNPYALSFVRELKRRGLPVCLTSDTYLSAEFVRRLLAKAGLGGDQYAAIFVSCEHAANKARGGLFKRVADALGPVEYSRILHVGDDLTGDVIQPSSLGMGCAHVRSSHLSAELEQLNLLLGVHAAEDSLAAVRLLGQAVAGENGDRDTFFLRFGAATLGPAMAAFCTWVVSDAAERGITKICPIMREGAILAPMMRRAAKALGVDVAVEELYSSRRAAFLPTMGELDARALEQYRSRRNFTLGDLIAELELPAPPMSLGNGTAMSLGDVEDQAALAEWLGSTEVQAAARQASRLARELFADYLEDLLGDHANVALVDLGPAGSTLAWVAECQRERSSRRITNYLFYATAGMVQNAARGHFYRTFCGGAPEVRALSQLFNRSPEPLEILLTGAHQTTIGYRREGRSGRVVPVTRCVFEAPEQQGAIAACARGMDLAWDHFSHCLAQVPLGHLLSSDARVACLQSLCRVLELPTPEEARHLGDLIFDDNAGSGYSAPICGDKDLAKLDAIGPEAFVANFRARWGYHADGVRWPQGTVTRAYPEFLVNLRRRVCSDVDHKFVCRDLVDHAQAAGVRTITVYGAGKIGHELVLHAEGRGVSVDFIVDSNPLLHGSSLSGRRIVSLETARAAGCGVYCIASVAFAGEIGRTIRDHYRQRGLEAPVILSIKG